MSEDKLIEIFCAVDDFCQEFSASLDAKLLSDGRLQRRGARSLSTSEALTLIIYFHHCRFRNFKHYYVHFVRPYLASYFPGLPSYSRFIQWMPQTLLALLNFVCNRCLGSATGIQYIDSTPLAVSHNRRIKQHRTFKGLAKRGKTSVGWFFGFKLHLIINHLGEIVSFLITPGNVSDVNHETVEKLCKKVWGKLFGDRGYISKALQEKLHEKGIELISKVRKNMKPQALPLMDRIMLAQRGVVECSIDALKNQAYVEHSRHRSFTGLVSNILGAIAAFAFTEKKPKPAFKFPFLVNVNPSLLLP